MDIDVVLKLTCIVNVQNSSDTPYLPDNIYNTTVDIQSYANPYDEHLRLAQSYFPREGARCNSFLTFHSYDTD